MEGIASGLLPTPTVVGGGQTLAEGTTQTGRTPDGRKQTVCLERYLNNVIAGKWPILPTPTVNGDYNRVGVSAKSGDGLMTALRRHLNGQRLGRRSFRRFREWMMGYPIDWTRPESTPPETP
jgi:hypothetical protein